MLAALIDNHEPLFIGRSSSLLSARAAMGVLLVRYAPGGKLVIQMAAENEGNAAKPLCWHDELSD